MSASTTQLHLYLPLVGLALLGGCLGGGGGSGPGAEPGTGASAAVDASRGGIEGLILSPEQLPLPGVHVALPRLGATTTTDAWGAFAFGLLPPGAYDVLAAQPGYAPATATVRVAAGAVSHLDLELVPLAASTPYRETRTHEGFIDCGYGFLDTMGSLACSTADDKHQVRFEFEVSRDVRSAVGELVWAPNSALSADRLRLTLAHRTVCAPVCGPSPDHGDALGSSPVRVRAHAPFAGAPFEGSPERATLAWEVWVPGGESADLPTPVFVLHQTFTLHQTLFYHAAAPEAFTVLAADA